MKVFFAAYMQSVKIVCQPGITIALCTVDPQADKEFYRS
jgi:hypothetical protein